MSAGEEAAPAVDVASKPKNNRKKLVVIGVIAIIVLAQMAVVYFLLLSPSGAKGGEGHHAEATSGHGDGGSHAGSHGEAESSSHGHSEASSSSHGSGHGHGGGTAHVAPGELVEIAIGTEFNCTNGKAHEGSVIHVNFKVVALVSGRDQEHFKEAIKAADARIKEAVMVVARQADTEALNDPNLGSIKRLIREHVNKILKKSYIQNIVISEYSLIER